MRRPLPFGLARLFLLLRERLVGFQDHLAHSYELELVRQALVAEAEALVLLQQLGWATGLSEAILERELPAIL